MMSINDGSSTIFCECGFIFHTCFVHKTIVQGRGPGIPENHICSCPNALNCPCSALLKVIQPGLLFCQECGKHYVWNTDRKLYVATQWSTNILLA
jgi:hypothetical protein